MTADTRGRIFWDADAYADPLGWQRVAAEIRQKEGVLRVEAEGFEPFWAVTRHADVMHVSQRHDTFVSMRDPVLFPTKVIEKNRAMGIELRTVLQMNGEDHTAYRRLTNDWFLPAALKALEPTIDDLAARFVDRLAEFDGATDFASDVCMPYPLHVIMSILGIPEEDEPRMLKLTQEIFNPQDAEYSANPEAQDAALMQAIMEFGAYFYSIVTDRRARPGSDLASVIANGSINGQPVGEVEAIGYYVAIATAGHDTTAGSLNGGVEQLLRHPEQLAALREDPDLVTNAVEEVIRWSSPVRHFLRQASVDTEVGGTPIAAGDTLLLSYLSANYDEEVFADPMRFDVTRRNARDHVAFGWGRHHCLGSQLARMELRSFLREFTRRVESMEIAGEPEWSASSFIGGIKHLPVRYRLRRDAD